MSFDNACVNFRLDRVIVAGVYLSMHGHSIIPMSGVEHKDLFRQFCRCIITI